MHMSGLDTYFLEVSTHALLIIARFFRRKTSEELAFLGYFAEAKTEEYD